MWIKQHNKHKQYEKNEGHKSGAFPNKIQDLGGFKIS